MKNSQHNNVINNCCLNPRLLLMYMIFLTVMPVFSQQSGPTYIKNLLSSKGVFNTPVYNFTSDYNEYRSYDNIKGLFIDALYYGENPSKVFCWYGVPEGLQEGEKAPAVVLVHGGGGTAFPEWVHQWNERGYIAIAIAHEGQLPGPKDPWYPTWEYSGPRRAGFFRDADKDISEQWFYHAIADAILAHSLLRSIPEVDTTNIGINGISWGGILTNVITGIDQRFKFSIPVYGCGFLYDSPKYSVDMALNTKAELEFYYANWEPSLYLPLQSLPVFYVNGSVDKQFAMNIATRTYKHIPGEKYLCIKNPLKHSTASGYSTQEVYEFADYITKNGTAPVKVSIDVVDSTTALASYQGSIDSALLIYTTDSMNWDYTSLVWTEKKAVVDSGLSQISSEIPKGTQFFFINVYTSEGFIFSSPMKKALFDADTTQPDTPSVPETAVVIKAVANTNYGIDKVATLTSEVRLAPDSIATYQISCDVTPSLGQGIMSGPGGGTSVETDWGVATSTDPGDILNVLFSGNKEWVSVDNLQIVNFEANGGDMTIDNFSDLSVQSVVVVNAQSSNKDAVALAVNGDTITIGNGVITQTHDTLHLESFTGVMPVSSFSIGTADSPNQDKNKWSIESIMVNFSYGQVLAKHQLRNEDYGHLDIIPNPAKTSFTVNAEAVSVHVYDFTGRCVKSDITGTNTVDISGLKSGSYIVHVNTRNGISLQGKLLKI